MVLVFLLLLLISTLWTEWSGTHLRLTEKLKFSKPCPRSPCASIWASSGYWIERSLRRLLWSSSGVFWQTLRLAVLQGWPNFPAVTSDIKPGVSFKISLPSVLFSALSARQSWLKPNRLHLTPWEESETVSLYRQERSPPNPWHICWWKDLWRTSVSVPAVPNIQIAMMSAAWYSASQSSTQPGIALGHVERQTRLLWYDYWYKIYF